MPSVSEFVQNEAETTITLENKKGNSVKIYCRYKPADMTTGRLERMAALERDGDITAFAQMFCDVVLEWDLEGPLYADMPVLDEHGDQVYSEKGSALFEREEIVGSGDTIPLDADHVKHMNAGALGMIWRELSAEQSGPDPQRPRGSRRR